MLVCISLCFNPLITHTHKIHPYKAAHVSIQKAPVNNAVLKVTARRELEGKQVHDTPHPPPIRQPHKDTLPCQFSLSASPQVLSCSMAGPGGPPAFSFTILKAVMGNKTLHTLSERYNFKYFTHILHMQFIHTWLLEATTSGSCCFRGN